MFESLIHTSSNHIFQRDYLLQLKQELTLISLHNINFFLMLHNSLHHCCMSEYARTLDSCSANLAECARNVVCMMVRCDPMNVHFPVNDSKSLVP